MRILVTNDDGFEAPGIKIAEKIALALSDDVWVVAPEADQSGRSHAITIHAPLNVIKHGDRHYAVTGTPSDCVGMGVHNLLPEPPDLILSGVNAGINAGHFISYSGTVGAVIEGMLNGIAGIALSQAYDWSNNERVMPWSVVSDHGANVVKRLLKHPLPDGTFYNVNFPNCDSVDVAGVKVTSQAQAKPGDAVEHTVDEEDPSRYWLKFGSGLDGPAVGTDRHALDQNAISVTPLQLDRTHIDVMKALENEF